MFPQTTKRLMAILISTAVLVYGCSKHDVEPSITRETKPVANAGDDQMIHLPDERNIRLNASRSYDPDAAGRPFKVLWSQLSGPPLFQFSETLGTATIQEPGTYSFELKVEDVQSLVDRDTVNITAVWELGCDPDFSKITNSVEQVLTLNRLIPLDASIASSAGRLVIAGGRVQQDDGWGGSDVYDSLFTVIEAGSKNILESNLSVGRSRIGITQAGSELFLAGGITSTGATDVIDIFDVNRRTMRKEKLSSPRSSVGAVAAGNLIFFAGGRAVNNLGSDVVDIYDINTRTFTKAKLSLPRADISAVAAGTKVFFIGGETEFDNVTGRVDIYDLNSGQWSVAELPTPRSRVSAAVAGDELTFYSGRDQKDKRIDQVGFMNTNSLALRTECAVGSDPNKWEFGQNVETAVIDKNIYYLGLGMISRKQAGSQKIEISYFTDETQPVSIYSDGADLFGLVRVGPPFWDYTTALELRKIRFQ